MKYKEAIIKGNPYFKMDILDVPYEPIVNQFSTNSNNRYLRDMDNWEAYIETKFDECLVKKITIGEANPTLNLSISENPNLVDNGKLFDSNTFFLEFCLYGDDNVGGDFYRREFKNVFSNSEELAQFQLAITKFMNTPHIDISKKGMIPTITSVAKINKDLYNVYKFFETYKGKRRDEILTNKNCEMEFVYYDFMKAYLERVYKIKPKSVKQLFKDKVLVLEGKQASTHFYVASFNTVVEMTWKFHMDRDTQEMFFAGDGAILWMDYASLVQPNLSPLIYRIPISNVVYPEPSEPLELI